MRRQEKIASKREDTKNGRPKYYLVNSNRQIENIFLNLGKIVCENSKVIIRSGGLKFGASKKGHKLAENKKLVINRKLKRKKLLLKINKD